MIRETQGKLDISNYQKKMINKERQLIVLIWGHDVMYFISYILRSHFLALRNISRAALARNTETISQQMCYDFVS